MQIWTSEIWIPEFPDSRFARPPDSRFQISTTYVSGFQVSRFQISRNLESGNIGLANLDIWKPRSCKSGNLESLEASGLQIWNLETSCRAGNQEIQTLETCRRRSLGGGGGIYQRERERERERYIYIYIYIHVYIHIYIYI